MVAQVGRLAGGDMGAWWMSPARDLLSAGIHIAGFLTRTVMWRGRKFHVARDGVLRPCRPQAVLGTAEPHVVGQPHLGHAHLGHAHLGQSHLGLAQEPSSAI